MKVETIKQFCYNGYDCKIKRIGVGHDIIPYFEDMEMRTNWLCGYVKLHKHHYLNGLDYNNDKIIDIECHGGITYADYEVDGNYWIGFDLNHCGDSLEVQNEEYAIKECQSIVEQIIEKEKYE